MAPSVEKLAETGVLFTVTSLPTVMNVHADAESSLWMGRAGPWEASAVRRCYVAFPGGRKGLSRASGITHSHSGSEDSTRSSSVSFSYTAFSTSFVGARCSCSSMSAIASTVDSMTFCSEIDNRPRSRGIVPVVFISSPASSNKVIAAQSFFFKVMSMNNIQND